MNRTSSRSRLVVTALSSLFAIAIAATTGCAMKNSAESVSAPMAMDSYSGGAAEKAAADDGLYAVEAGGDAADGEVAAYEPPPPADYDAPAEAEEDMAPMAAPEPASAPAPVAKERSSRRADRKAKRAQKKAKTKSKPKKDMALAGAVMPAQPAATPIAPNAQQPVATHQPTPQHNTEGYDHIQENEFLAVADKPLSTFSIDVDTASYSNVRRYLDSGSLPPVDAVRIEELVNYFRYNYGEPGGNRPFSVTTEVAACPWNQAHKLVHVGIKGKTVKKSEIPARNLVFLFDVSGSMNSADKLPLLKKAMAKLVKQLDGDDRVSIVVYAGASGMVLPPTSGRSKAKILGALNRLEAGGSTNGGAGIQLAYDLAQRSFVKGGINRVILATDGDFNVGTTSRGDLERLIEEKRKSGVFLSVFGFGTGNVKDSQMEMLADKGNGNYAYIDSIREAHKVLVEEVSSTLVTIAKDVKIQVEFNPSEVESYRLIGYENRKMADKDFNDDTKDAGEIGAGHTVTALYEVVPRGAGEASGKSGVDPLRYQKGRDLARTSDNGEMMYLKLRYKKPDGHKSTLMSYPIRDRDQDIRETSNNFRFSAAVAGFGMLLRGSKYSGQASFGDMYKLGKGATGRDSSGYRREFLRLVKTAAKLKGEKTGLAIAR